ncbi:restriction endonuclease subunit S [Paenibacillus sp. MSJ-34]|uniref:restriction endonuclease subunit S n=1 Tax=Paenibacillus sp. MSJ-34 TaxID=2841529 RepID=UPI001C1231E1|nr:restriction endonuclease subunit S [Paenibacillus sp. MSJ-34]MBU5443380.1 restriction endonuclease subunit S [Paenibacillus sp. MSJ-34]
MSFEWKEVRLSDIAEFANGKKRPSESGKIPVYGGNGIMDYTNSYNSEGETVIIGRVGAYCGNVHYENQPCWISDNAIAAKPCIKGTGRYLYYKLKSMNLYNMRIGSSQPLLTQSLIKDIVMKIPSTSEQIKISDILTALDYKIELNNAINKNLEEMAQALFNSWFVDFEFPNENGEPYKSSGGEFEESELGLIPKGWKQGTISELGEVAGGATPSKKNEDFYTVRGIPWITPKDLSKTNNKYISRGEIDITQKGFSNSSVKLLPKGTVLFSSRAPIGYIAIAKNEVTTNQGFKSVIPFKHVGSEFVYYLLKSNVETIECRASGSTFKEISGTEMKRVPVLIPTENVLAKFNEIVEPIGRLTQKCEEENEDLTQIRDTLLPKLMSGEIRVPVEQDHNHPDLPKVAESSAIYQP